MFFANVFNCLTIQYALFPQGIGFILKSLGIVICENGF